MKRYLEALYFMEVDSARLNFERDGRYQKALSQVYSLLGEEDLPAPVFRLLDVSNRISFVHGLLLGLRLRRWANRLS